MPIAPDLVPVPVRFTQGPSRQRQVLCGSAQCVAARAAGQTNGTRAVSAGINMVPKEMTGVAICADCGTKWRVVPGSVYSRDE